MCVDTKTIKSRLFDRNGVNVFFKFVTKIMDIRNVNVLLCGFYRTIKFKFKSSLLFSYHFLG